MPWQHERGDATCTGSLLDLGATCLPLCAKSKRACITLTASSRLLHRLCWAAAAAAALHSPFLRLHASAALRLPGPGRSPGPRQHNSQSPLMLLPPQRQGQKTPPAARRRRCASQSGHRQPAGGRGARRLPAWKEAGRAHLPIGRGWPKLEAAISPLHLLFISPISGRGWRPPYLPCISSLSPLCLAEAVGRP